MPRVALIIAQRNFRDEELLQTREVLQRFKVDTVVAAERLEPAYGKFGLAVAPDLTYAQIQPDDFDAAVFIGGPGARANFERRTLLRRARQFAAAGKAVAAICTAPVMLANAGLLMGKRATAFPTEEQTLRDRGAEYTGLPVEVDGKIVTAKDSTCAREFAEKIAWVIGA